MQTSVFFVIVMELVCSVYSLSLTGPAIMSCLTQPLSRTSCARYPLTHACFRARPTTSRNALFSVRHRSPFALFIRHTVHVAILNSMRLQPPSIKNNVLGSEIRLVLVLIVAVKNTHQNSRRNLAEKSQGSGTNPQSPSHCQVSFDVAD